ncbi:MAG TPA: putative baseplate assembly protein [Vicinamibacterales bacterium]|nr:putative baseplate assembly protein [Vicinamibacterales bacterium]
MPILPPSLDDRRFDDLVEDLIARIPAHTPEWTNPRLGDPGRTLIELFAWLGDSLLYRANLIPERQRLVFLSLLGIGLKPARAATGIISLSYGQPTERRATTLRPGARVNGPVPFETLGETTVLPVSGQAYIKRRLTDAEATQAGDLIAGLARIHRISGAATGYQTLPVFDGRAETAGIDVFATSADRALWIALIAPEAPQPAQQAAVNEEIRSALGGGDTGAPALISIGIVPALKMPETFEEIAPPSPIPVQWEITTRGRTAFETDYLTLEPLPGADGTNGLTRPGVLRLSLPDESLIWAPSNDVGENPAAGVGDTPPRIDDAARAARLIAWLRLRPRTGQQVERLSLTWIGINAVDVDQRTTLAGRVLGTSTGAGDQVFQLPRGSVDPSTLQVQVEEPGRGYQPWTRVEDLGAVSGDPRVAREAPVFELDPEAGTLRFGDGVRGRIPERQMRVRLASGRFGGGRAGNLPAASLTEINAVRLDGRPAPVLKVAQPIATNGGADPESIAEAQRRIPSCLRHRERAVTAQDYKALALEAPGVDVGRVDVLPRFKPHDRRFGVPGVVSVMALPAQPMSGPPNPRPDRPFIERLHAHFSTRTPLATELYVIGCEYVPLGIATTVSLREGHDRDATLFAIRDALKRLLWPLPPGGIESAGWPLGRSVREREIEVEISRVAGVGEVGGINLFQRGDGENGPEWRLLSRNTADPTQTLTLEAWQLPELLSVLVVDGLPGQGAPTDLRALPNPFADDSAVAVPVEPEVC